MNGLHRFPYRRPLWRRFLLVGVILCASRAHAQALHRDGTKTVGRLVGSSPVELRWITETNPTGFPLDGIRTIQGSAHSANAIAPGPLRRIRLIDGDTFIGRLRLWDENQIRCTLFGTADVAIPRTELAGIAALSHSADVFYEDFEQANKRWTEVVKRRKDGRGEAPNRGRATFQLASPVDRGRLTLTFVSGSPTDWGIKLIFAKPEDALTLSLGLLTVSGNGVSQQPLPRTSSPRQLSASFDDSGVTFAVDGAVLATARHRSALRSVELYRREQATDAGWIDDVWLTRTIKSKPIRRQLSQQDAIWLHTGDALFGRVTTVGSQHVKLRTAVGEVALTWSRIASMSFRRQDEPPSRPTTGWHAEFQLASPDTVPTRLTAAIQSTTQTAVRVDHRVLGKLAIPFDLIHSIRPLFRGERQRLLAGPVHLGNHLNPKFAQPRPAGTKWSGSLHLKDSIPKSARIRLTVGGLEPSGPRTPLGSPHLGELRASRLVTQFVLNGKRVTELNSLINRRDDAAELVIALPEGGLKAGENPWELRQISSLDDPGEFDDIEFGPVWWENSFKP